VAKSGRLEVTSRNGLRGVSASERGQESEKFPLLVLGRPQGKPFRYGISDGREKISVFFQYHMNQPEPLIRLTLRRAPRFSTEPQHTQSYVALFHSARLTEPEPPNGLSKWKRIFNALAVAGKKTGTGTSPYTSFR
jgi:hypothetical protein